MSICYIKSVRTPKIIRLAGRKGSVWCRAASAFGLGFLFLSLILGREYWLNWRGGGLYKHEILGTTTLQSEWEAGEYYPGTIDTVSSPGDLKIARGAGITWSPETPGFITEESGYGRWSYDAPRYGADLTTDGYYIYIITGNRRPHLIRYNPELNTFKLLKKAPTSFLYGGSITYYNGALYAIDGGEQNETGEATKHFYKYDIASDSWSKLADAPDAWGLGSDIVSDGNGTIYAVRGRSTYEFWSYDVAGDTWNESLPNVSPYQIYTTNGHPLVFVNEAYGSPEVCSSGCLFAFRGNNNRQFMRFDIGENQWYSATEIPSALGGVHYGSSLAYDSVNGNLYALRGYNDDEFMKYDVDAETWDSASGDTPDAPGAVYRGGALVYLNGYIYALRGENLTGFWRYDISGGEWNSIATPSNVGNNGEDGFTTRSGTHWPRYLGV